MKSSIFSFFLCLIVLSACSTSSTDIISSPPTVVTKLTPTPTALPHPGWYQERSIVWSGYSSPQGGILGVRSQWIEPQVSGGPNSNLFIWIGVGGWGQTLNELVQIGTLAYTDTTGQTAHKVWYETVPQLSTLTSMIVYPGDNIAALMELEPGSTRDWHLSLHDITQNTSFAINVSYPSSQVYADFIVEDPHEGSTDLSAPLYPFQQFTSVSFTGAQVHYANGWYSIGSLRMMQVTMVQDGKTVAYPGDITLPDSFSITHA